MLPARALLAMTRFNRVAGAPMNPKFCLGVLLQPPRVRLKHVVPFSLHPHAGY